MYKIIAIFQLVFSRNYILVTLKSKQERFKMNVNFTEEAANKKMVAAVMLYYKAWQESEDDIKGMDNTAKQAEEILKRL